MEEGHDRPVGGARAVRRHAAGRRPRARAHRVPLGVVLGHRGPVRPGLVQREARRRRRQARRHRQGLQRPRRAHPRRRRAPLGGVGDLAGHRARRAVVRRALGRGQALPPLARCSVHDLDAAAGGQPQAALGRAAHDARGAGPLRARLHHLHAYRLHHAVGVGDERGARAGGRALRLRPRLRGAAPLRPQGEERAGGARGRASRRRRLPYAGAGGRRAARRRLRALRPHLEAHRRLADGRRARSDRHDPPRRGRHRRSRRRVLGQRHRDHVPRIPRGVRGVDRRRGRARRRRRGRAPAAAAQGRRRAHRAAVSSPRATRPTRRRATPRRAWSRRSRSAASAGRRRTPRSWGRSSTAGTS